MKKLTNKKTLIIDAITFLLVLVFPLIPSHDHELFMTFLSIALVLTFFSNISLVRFSYKSDLSFEENFKVALMIWAKIFILMTLLNVEVQGTYLDNAIANHGLLNIYSGKAIIGWELSVWMYRIAVFYVPIIAGINTGLYVIFLLIAKAFKRFNLLKVLVKFAKKLTKKVKEIKTILINFNNKILNLIKANKSTRTVDYLSMQTELFTNNKKAQLPPLFNF